MARRSCATCEYFDETGPFCRRYAPRARFLGQSFKDEAIGRSIREATGIETVDADNAQWPYVEENDWCGEWDKADG